MPAEVISAEVKARWGGALSRFDGIKVHDFVGAMRTNGHDIPGYPTDVLPFDTVVAGNLSIETLSQLCEGVIPIRTKFPRADVIFPLSGVGDLQRQSDQILGIDSIVMVVPFAHPSESMKGKKQWSRFEAGGVLIADLYKPPLELFREIKKIVDLIVEIDHEHLTDETMEYLHKLQYQQEAKIRAVFATQGYARGNEMLFAFSPQMQREVVK